jgi:hypothetical protein
MTPQTMYKSLIYLLFKPYMCKPIREGGIGFDLHLKNLSFSPNIFKEPS